MLTYANDYNIRDKVEHAVCSIIRQLENLLTELMAKNFVNRAVAENIPIVLVGYKEK